jgi:hypothetical protein
MPFQRYEYGYDVKAIGSDEPPRPTGWLEFPYPGGHRVNIWVIEVTISFGLAGTTAQSRHNRSFFPHNSIPPSINVHCIAPNQHIYGHTLEFIRSSQAGLDTSYLYIKRGGISAAGYTHKGRHEPVAAEGYVQAASRHHERHTYSPEFDISYVVSRMASPFGPDTDVRPTVLKDWTAIVNTIMREPNTGFAEDPDSRPRPTTDPEEAILSPEVIAHRVDR